MGTKEQLLAAVRPRVDDDAWTWLSGAMRTAEGADLNALLSVYTDASQRMGAALLDGPPPAASGARFERWTLEDAARAALMLSRADAAADTGDFFDAAVACYEQGDAREQQSWLRAVALLPAPERFLPSVIDACRSSILPVFEAVACENPYPSRYFPDRNFNQMVLKALFNGVALGRVVGLPARRNPELSRMAADYAAERRAAGRSVPDDISLVTSAPGAPGSS